MADTDENTDATEEIFPVASTLKIGSDIVDLNKPCDVCMALKKLQIRLAGSDLRETVRIDGEEVTFHRGSDTRLQKLIDIYDRACGRTTGKRRRFAAAIRF